MSMSGFDKSKFVFSETFNNKDGKTSGSGFLGIVLGLTGAVCFAASMIGWFLQIPNVVEVMGKIIILLSLAAALLGLRKFVGSKDSVAVDDGNGDNHDNHHDDHGSSDIILETPKKV